MAALRSPGAAHCGVMSNDMKNLDEVTGHLCDDCYEAEARGDDLPFLDAAVTYEVSEENLAPGYFDCIECNDVAIGGHAVTTYFRP